MYESWENTEEKGIKILKMSSLLFVLVYKLINTNDVIYMVLSVLNFNLLF